MIAIAASCFLAITASVSIPTSAPAAAAEKCTESKTLVSSCGIQTGAYVQPRGGETAESAFKRFERQIGEKQQIVHYYHQGTQLFPSPWEIALSKGGHRLMLSWKPENGHTWAQVAKGAADSYINREARYIKGHYSTKRFYLAIHHEPEDEVLPWRGSGYTATDYRQMYRHVEDRFRAEGVKNAVFVMVYMGAQTYVTRPWFKNLWPGARYVDWVAYDPYVTPKTNGQSGGVSWLLNAHWGSKFPGMYNWLTRRHPHKPIMLAEWGVAEKPGDSTYKADVFIHMASKISDYPKIKAMIYFENPQARSGQVQTDTSRASLNGYRVMIARLA